jgi:eukaryotic-like serine/threonine-protein kinase
LPESSILAGKYRLIHQLGRGGMGSVWLAQHLTLRSNVAVKLIDPSIATQPEALERFMREARAAATLRSPHVVQILDHGVDGAIPYIAMELLEGESLADRLHRLGRLPPMEVARILTHIGRAVSRAHEAGIVHRDLKPDNVFLVENEEEEMAKVLDFGIAKSNTDGLGASAASDTRTGVMMGTIHYMSPEQTEGARSLDGRADIWAMGVIAFECLLARRPFDEETLGSVVLAICSRPLPVPSAIAPVPAGFDDWFARACARDVHARFPTAREATAALRAICEGDAALRGERETDTKSAPNAPTTFDPAPVGPGRRAPVRIAAVGAVGLAVAVVIAVIVYRWDGGSVTVPRARAPLASPAPPANPVLRAPPAAPPITVLPLPHPVTPRIAQPVTPSPVPPSEAVAVRKDRRPARPVAVKPMHRPSPAPRPPAPSPRTAPGGATSSARPAADSARVNLGI